MGDDLISAPMPIPTANNITKKPRDTPIAWGIVRFNPKLMPDARSIILFGPGVIEVTNENMANDKKMSKVIYKILINK